MFIKEAEGMDLSFLYNKYLFKNHWITYTRKLPEFYYIFKHIS